MDIFWRYHFGSCCDAGFDTELVHPDRHVSALNRCMVGPSQVGWTRGRHPGFTVPLGNQSFSDPVSSPLEPVLQSRHSGFTPSDYSSNAPLNEWSSPS